MIAHLIGLGLGVIGLLFSWRALKRLRLIDNLPTSKCRGVFIGTVELKGNCRCEKPLTSHLAEVPCAYYDYRVDERWSRTVTETYTDSKGRRRTRTKRDSGWKPVAFATRYVPFELEDETGRILIHPDHAEVEAATVFEQTCRPDAPLYYAKAPAAAVPDSDHVRRFCETAILLDAPLFLIGRARERQDRVEPEIAYDPDAPMFLISTREEKSVRSAHAWAFWLWGLFAVAACSAPFLMADGASSLAGFWLALAAAGFAWWLGWLVVAFNALIDLRQRVRQAWSSIDVQLKRRHDLIPRLVEILQAQTGHERSVQEALARIRAQADATAPGQPGPHAAATTAAIRQLAEAYPRLQTSNAFLQLQCQLAETEDRIALARAYFNDIATFYNNRLETFPDGLVALLGAFRKQPLMEANGLERTPPAVAGSAAASTAMSAP